MASNLLTALVQHGWDLKPFEAFLPIFFLEPEECDGTGANQIKDKADGGACKACKDKQVPNTDKDECVDCKENEIVTDGNSKCTPCTGELKPNEAKTECIKGRNQLPYITFTCLFVSFWPVFLHAKNLI